MEKVDNLSKLVEGTLRSSRSIIALVDALAGRGAFKGEELIHVGQLREQAAQLIGLAESVQNEQTDKPETEKTKS